MAELRVSEQTPQHLRLIWLPEGRELEQGRGALIGVPTDGQVRLELVEARVAQTDRAAEDEAPTPGPVLLGESGFVRRQRVVPLAFAPRIEADGTRTLYDRVVVDLHLTGSSGSHVADPWGEAFYRGLLVNPEQAKSWRLPRKRRSAHKAALPEGTWLRILVAEEGIYRISGADLEAAGVSLGAVNPASLRLYYGGGNALPIDEINPPQALREEGLVVEDGGDGRLDADDFVLFWAEPVSRWEYVPASRSFQYQHNLYTHENAYWLGFGGGSEGGRAAQRSGALAASDPLTPTSYRVRIHEEAEQFVLIQLYGMKSGYTWYWEHFRGNARNFPVVVRQAAPEPVAVRLGFIGGAETRPRFEVRWNEESIGTVAIATPAGSGQMPIASDTLWAPQGAQEGLNHLGLFHSGSPVRLDWYEVEYSRGFVAERGELHFTYPLTSTTQFRLAGLAAEQPRVFEVSAGLAEVVDFEYDAQAGTVIFQDRPGDVPRHYAVGGPATWKRPVRIELDWPGALTTRQGADWVAIYHRDFRAAAERLAQWRAEDDRFGPPLRAMAIDVQDIYDEFSGGLLDPAAIRNFLAYAAEHWDPAPLFVALIGDGSYDYKNNSALSQGNWIPPFQDGDSTYDEWYTRVVGGDLFPDMAVGRLTVQTPGEADVVVDKIIAYDRTPELGPWQGRQALVADDLLNRDEPGTVESMFIRDSEYMARNVLPNWLDLSKLYIAQFPLEGREKPRARDEFIRLFNKGALTVTYLGHGSFNVLAHESMFLLDRDLDKLKNGGRLPLFFTAASQVGVFDDPVRISVPEALLKKEDGGVIGMICATRVGYHTTNVRLANQFYWQLHHTGRKHVPIGLALFEAKQLLLPLYSRTPLEPTTFRNIQRYSLFGDPATRLAMPRFQVQIDAADSLRALGEVAIAGQILDAAGAPATAYAGQVWLQAFDSSEASDLEGYTYQQTGAPIFRGRFPVAAGRFRAAFRVPKDITYGGENGRISAYVWSDDRPAAFGAVDELVLAGTAKGVEADVEGPEISLRFAGAKGRTIPRQTVLLASLADPSGINITGETGHEIELAIDGELFTLTELYSVQGGDYRQGVIEFPLPELASGKHELGLKAWDNFNNSSRETVVVTVGDDGGDASFANVLFYPNPMRDSGYFTYELADDVQAVQIEVFSLAGRLIERLAGQTHAGYNQVPWTPPPDLANGAYIYRIAAERKSGAAVVRRAVLQVAK